MHLLQNAGRTQVVCMVGLASLDRIDQSHHVSRILDVKAVHNVCHRLLMSNNFQALNPVQGAKSFEAHAM